MAVARGAARTPTLCVPHGGGPLPLLADVSHKALTNWLTNAAQELVEPKAIVTISAHWEVIRKLLEYCDRQTILACFRRVCCNLLPISQEHQPTVTSAERPALIYDYSGFPEESYSIRYDAPGSPQLAQRIQELLHSAGLSCALDSERGWDHGVFVPLKLLYPAANVPLVELSLLKSLSAEVLAGP